jgi:membrane protease YdiL (CAAX protease family)
MGTLLGAQRPQGLAWGLTLSALKGAVWILPALAIARTLIREPATKSLGLVPDGSQRHGVRALAISVAFLALTTGLQTLTSARSPDVSIPVFPGLLLDISNALVEEISFRGFILRWLAKSNPFWRANLITSLLFLFVHWIGWFSHGAGFELVPMSFALVFFSLILGWITLLSGSVWMAVGVHALNNLIASRFGAG